MFLRFSEDDFLPGLKKHSKALAAERIWTKSGGLGEATFLSWKKTLVRWFLPEAPSRDLK